MAMNKFIHPRNIYKKHPDFKQLRLDYPEFRGICTDDETGKPVVNFQDERSIAILTKCLLHKDFDLKVDFPVNRLIPTLPLRLNYILWIEDILNTFGIKDASGIDIGCGASCIYPLLAAKKNNWNMKGLEIDPDSYSKAKDNVSSNGLNDKITVQLQSSTATGVFDALLEGNSLSFDFCLCNPPFYDDSSSSDPPKNRTGNRPGPRNAKTGCPVELSCDGGEVNFIRKIITASMKFKSRIRVFTTMIGIKNDLIVLVKELRRLGITNYIETEFCQGRTTRWGLAWTFEAEDDKDIYLRTVPCIRSTFAKEPAIFFIPELNGKDIVEKGKVIEEALRNLFKEIQIELILLPETMAKEKRWRVKVHKVTWTNTRRKRREQQRDKGKDEEEDESPEGPAKKQRLDLGRPILVADVYMNCVDNGHTLQIFYLDGSQGKDACQQILQVVINRFNKLF